MSSIFASISRIDLDGRHIHYPYADITRYINKKQKQLWPKNRQVLGSPWKNKDRSFPQRGSAEAECLSVKKTKRRCAKGRGEKPMESADLLPISGHEPLPLSILKQRSDNAPKRDDETDGIWWIHVCNPLQLFRSGLRSRVDTWGLASIVKIPAPRKTHQTKPPQHLIQVFAFTFLWFHFSKPEKKKHP